MLICLLRTLPGALPPALIAVVVLSLIGTMASLFLPSLNAAIIDEGVATGDTAFIWRTGQTMLAVSLLQIFCTIAATYLGAKIAMGFGRDVRGAIFDRVLAFSARELNRFGAPTLITRNTNDVQQVQMLVLLSCTMFITAPITMIGGVIMALREDIGLSWLVAVAVPVLAISISLVVRKMRPLFRMMQTRIDTVNRVLREQITGIRVVRAFVREPYETARFADGQRRPDGHGDLGRPADGLDVPDRHVDLERLQRRRALVRRPAGRGRADADRLADGLSGLPDPDPVVGHDGHLPADARPRAPRSARSGSARCWTPTPRSCRPPSRSPPCRCARR